MNRRKKKKVKYVMRNKNLNHLMNGNFELWVTKVIIFWFNEGN